MQNTSQIPSTTLFERILASLGAGLCLIVTVYLWRGISVQQPMWPLPALYFIEMAALGILSAFMCIRGGPREKFIIWGATGAMLGFSILGAWSVGFFYLPVALIFTIISITSNIRSRKPIAAYLGVCLLAGIVQVALMLAVIRLFI